MRAIAVFLLVLGHLALCQGWTCTEGPRLNKALQVDAGQGQVVATDTYRQAYFLSGSSWSRLPKANLKHISVGEAGIWGIDVSDRIYKYVGGSWARVSGALMQVDAGGNGFAAGVNRANRVYCLRSAYTRAFNGRGSVAWNEVGGRLKYFSCGPYGCWGVNSANQIFFNVLRSAATCSFAGWKHIAGSLTMIEVGTDGNAFGANKSGQVFQRTGISKARPYGSGWTVVPLCKTMRQVSYDLGTIYGVSTSGVIMKCTA